MSGVLSTTAGRRRDGIPSQLIEMFRAVFVDNSTGFEDVDLLMRKQTLVSGQPIENGCRVHIAPKPVSLDLTDVLLATSTSGCSSSSSFFSSPPGAEWPAVSSSDLRPLEFPNSNSRTIRGLL